jgi:hypothetical protein
MSLPSFLGGIQNILLVFITSGIGFTTPANFVLLSSKAGVDCKGIPTGGWKPFDLMLFQGSRPESNRQLSRREANDRLNGSQWQVGRAPWDNAGRADHIAIEK